MSRILDHARRQAIAYVALFIALSGTTYAATSIPDRSPVVGEATASKKIGAKRLKTNSVTARAIRRNAVRGSEVRESSLGRVPRATAASLLGGSTLAQVRSGIDAAALGGTPRSGFYDSGQVDTRLPRATEERTTGEQTFSSGNPVDRISLDLAAPRDGFALVIASGTIHPNANIAAGTCNTEMFVPEIPQAGRVATFSAGDTTISYETIATSWIVPVEAGTSTFTLRFAINPNVSLNCATAFSAASSSVNAVWIPQAG
jgi:hypothetical protein